MSGSSIPSIALVDNDDVDTRTYINNMVSVTKYMQKWYGFKSPKIPLIYSTIHILLHSTKDWRCSYRY